MEYKLGRRSSSVPQGLDIPKSPRTSRWTQSSPRRSSSSRSLQSAPTTPRISPHSSPCTTPSSTPPETPRDTPRKPRTRAEIYEAVLNMNDTLQSITLRVHNLEKITDVAVKENQKERVQAKPMALLEIDEEAEDETITCIQYYNKCIILYIECMPSLSLFVYLLHTDAIESY